MTARAGMTQLISTLRGLAQAGTADYSVAGSAYWSDDHLQEILDRYRTDVFREELYPRHGYLAGNVLEYKEYRSNYVNMESGTAVFVIQDAAGSAIGTANYAVDYMRGVVTFAADQGGSARYLDVRSYNLNAAAADVWRQKAGHFSIAKFDWSTDGHSIKRGDMADKAMKMADFYDSQAGADTVEMLV